MIKSKTKKKKKPAHREYPKLMINTVTGSIYLIRSKTGNLYKGTLIDGDTQDRLGDTSSSWDHDLVDFEGRLIMENK